MSLNPWPFIATLVVTTAVSFSAAWYIQGLRIDVLQSKYDTFVDKTTAEGEAAQKLAAEKDAQNQQAKEEADNEYKTRLHILLADNERLRKSRTSGGIVPKAATTSRRPDLACFDRAEFIAAIQRLDDSVFKLVNKGDERALEVNIAREWAKSLNLSSE